MSLRILLRDQPQRSIALVTDTHALIFRHSHVNISTQSHVSPNRALAPRCMVEFSALNTVDLSDYKSFPQLSIYGTLGLISINSNVFLCIISGAALVATIRPGETVQRIISVDFC